MDVIHLISGIVGLVLIVYLIVALLLPEIFL